MTKTLFRSRRRKTPAYPTREDDRRRLLAAGLGALLAAGPLAGCDSRPASTQANALDSRPGEVAQAPQDSEASAAVPTMRTDGMPSTASDTEAVQLREAASEPDAGRLERRGGVPVLPREPLPEVAPAPVPPPDGGTEPKVINAGVPRQP